MHSKLFLELTNLWSEFSMYIFFFPSEYFLLLLVIIIFNTNSQHTCHRLYVISILYLIISYKGEKFFMSYGAKCDCLNSH